MNKAINEFLDHYMLNSETNEWYRYFPAENIKIDLKNRELTFFSTSENSNFWVPDFETRTFADSEFLNNFSENFLENFLIENSIFSLDFSIKNFEKFKEYNSPEIWWRVALAKMPIYIDKSWVAYVNIPITNDKEIYKWAWKSNWRIIRWNNLKINWNKILTELDPRNNTLETNKIFQIQKENKNEKIISEVSSDFWRFWLWLWKVKFISKKWVETLNDLAIFRANDWTFELLKSNIFYSEEDLLQNFQTIENISFQRPSCMVRLDELMNFSFWWDLKVEKIFFKNEETSIENLPEFFKKLFLEENWKKILKNFQVTPPLQAIIKNLKVNMAMRDFTEIIWKVINRSEAFSVWNTDKWWKISEEIFSKNIWITKNTKIISEYLDINNDFKEKILEIKNLSDENKRNLINYIEKSDILKTKMITFEPDFIYKIDNKQIFLEYKMSAKSLKIEQLYKMQILKIFSEKYRNLNYYQVVWWENEIQETHKDIWLWFKKLLVRDFLLEQKNP